MSQPPWIQNRYGLYRVIYTAKYQPKDPAVSAQTHSHIEEYIFAVDAMDAVCKIQTRVLKYSGTSNFKLNSVTEA